MSGALTHQRWFQKLVGRQEFVNRTNNRPFDDFGRLFN